ncbi:MAG TPA: hypothetical protein VF678_10525 [bacterium]
MTLPRFAMLPVLLAFALGAILGAAQAQEKAPAREEGTWMQPFEAYAVDGNTVLYTGDYTMERKGGLLREMQVYRDLNGKVVHRVESLYDEVNHRPVLYESSDFAADRGAHVSVTAKGWDYELRDSKGNVTKSGHYDGNSSTYVWPNLMSLVDANWDEVKAGKVLSLELFFSSIGNTLAVKVAADGKSTLPGVQGEQFKVFAANAIVKLVMNPIYIVFSDETPRRLVAFEGRSVVTDANKKNIELRIVFGPRKTG